MPPPNWRKEEDVYVLQVVDAGQVGNSRIRKLWKRTSTSGSGHGFGDYFEFAKSDEEDTGFKIPKSFTKHAVQAPVNVTPTKPTVAAGFEFSIYADLASQDTRHLLTPVRPPIREVGLTLLKNASERVSEILRENRRRLDAGEDPDTVRKAARRKRAMELSAARRGRAKLFS